MKISSYRGEEFWVSDPLSLCKLNANKINFHKHLFTKIINFYCEEKNKAYKLVSIYKKIF